MQPAHPILGCVAQHGLSHPLSHRFLASVAQTRLISLLQGLAQTGQLFPSSQVLVTAELYVSSSVPEYSGLEIKRCKIYGSMDPGEDEMEALKHQSRLRAVLRSAPLRLLHSLLRERVHWLPAHAHSSDGTADGDPTPGALQAGGATGGEAEVAPRLRWRRALTCVTPANLSLRRKASIWLLLQTSHSVVALQVLPILLCEAVEMILLTEHHD